MRTPARAIVVLAVIGAVAYGVLWMWPITAKNPDPNHVHADFAVWVNGTLLDFSAPEYMSAPPVTGSATSFQIIPSAFAHGDEDEGETIPGREYLHLHDGNGHVIHRHKPGLTLGSFFSSIALSMSPTCLTLDEHQFDALDQNWVRDFARTKQLCNDGKFRWTFVVNGQGRPMDPTYVLNDLDRILLSYSASDTAWQDQWATLTDDACRYSKTCPWKGAPPTESCIADPMVPCVGT
ncbi:hypothetical protein EXS70_03610 [Candidatus Peribacteria bacterium]|nr:hypothetical protein [Candidatus Peribacteria bacterium]